MIFFPDGRHCASQELYDHLSSWIHPSIPFSSKDSWGRFGILGVLGDMILRTLPGTHIIEIGTGESSVYLTQLARLHNRSIFYCDASPSKITNPLTIKGYLHEDTIMLEGNPDVSEYKSKNAVAYAGTSDDMFKNLDIPTIGLAFIDGEHHYEYVKRDFENIFRNLCDDGYIFIHDTYPYDEELVLGDYCADSYKIRQELEKDDRVDTFCFNKMVACNVGMFMVRKKPQNRPYYQQ